MPAMHALTASLITRALTGDQHAQDAIDAAARHALRHAELHPVARIIATHEVRAAIHNAPRLDTYGTYVRQAARTAIRDVAGTGKEVSEYEATIRDACRRAAAGYPTITPEHLYADVQVALEQVDEIRNFPALVRSLARTARKRRLTADSAHGLGGEDDARRGHGGLTEYLRELTNAKRTSARSEQRKAAALADARKAVADAQDDAERSVATARLEMLEARMVGEAQAETRNVWVYLDAIRDDGTSAAADFEFVTTGELGETETSARWRNALVDEVYHATGWNLIKITRAVHAFWDGALRELRVGATGYSPSLYSTAATLTRAGHREHYATDAGLTNSEWAELVRLICGQDATQTRPAEIGLITVLRAIPDLAPQQAATPPAPTLALLEQAA